MQDEYKMFDSVVQKARKGILHVQTPVPETIFAFVINTYNPLSYFSFQPVLHDWCIKSRRMCYPVCGMMHIKEPMLLIGNSSPCGGSGFPL